MNSPIESEIIQVSLSSDNPAEASKIVNAVVDAYLSNYGDKERNEKLKRREALERKLKETRDTLRDKKEKYRELSKTIGSPTDAQIAREQASKLIDLSAEIRRKILEKKLDSIAAEIRKNHAATDSAEARKATEDLEIAEFQRSHLEKMAEDLSKELQEKINAATQHVGDVQLEILGAEIATLEKMMEKTAADLAVADLQVKVDLRIQRIQEATIPENSR